jgi:hypothetical protein
LLRGDSRRREIKHDMVDGIALRRQRERGSYRDD